MAAIPPFRLDPTRYSYGAENLPLVSHWSGMFAYRRSGAGIMRVQEQEVRKNYIGIVSDTTEEQRVVDSVARSRPVVKDYLRDLMAAVLKRRGKA